MKLFYIPSKKNIASDLFKFYNFHLGIVEVGKFLNGDLYVQLGETVKDDKCLILGGTDDLEILETAFLSSTLKKEGAKEVIAIIPYLSYGRQDRNIKGKSLGVKIVGDILKVSGVDKVVVIDLHSKECKNLFPIPLVSLNSYKFIIKHSNINKLKEISLVAPDKGAVEDVGSFKKLLISKIPIPVFYIEKKRTDKRIKIIGSHGTVLKNVILVDDVLDSGWTMIEAVKEIKNKGAKNIIIVVSHGVFSGEKWKELWSLGVSKIYCTDSVGKKVKDKRVIYSRSSEIFSEYFK